MIELTSREKLLYDMINEMMSELAVGRAATDYARTMKMHNASLETIQDMQQAIARYRFGERMKLAEAADK